MIVITKLTLKGEERRYSCADYKERAKEMK
jgi:hypothetical protein